MLGWALGVRANGIGDVTYAGHFDLHHIARRERANPRRRSGRDDVPWKQRHDPGDVRDEARNAEHHLGSARALALEPVDTGHDTQAVGQIRRDDLLTDWAKRI